MNRYIAASIATAAAGACLGASSQVVSMTQSAVTRTVRAMQSSGEAEIRLSIVPATVTLARGRREQGWFTIVSEPRQKLYWWRFQAGTYEEGSSFPADDFDRTCRVYVEPKRLVVFCTTARHLLIAASQQTYRAEAGFLELVQAEFNRRAAQLDTGFDFFDKRIDLWKPLGPDFFSGPGRANSIARVGLRSVSQPAGNWSVVVLGAGDTAVRLTLDRDFSLQRSEPVR